MPTDIQWEMKVYKSEYLRQEIGIPRRDPVAKHTPDTPSDSNWYEDFWKRLDQLLSGFNSCQFSDEKQLPLDYCSPGRRCSG